MVVVSDYRVERNTCASDRAFPLVKKRKNVPAHIAKAESDSDALKRLSSGRKVVERLAREYLEMSIGPWLRVSYSNQIIDTAVTFEFLKVE